MSQTLYDQLATMTVVVADTGDINSIKQYAPRDTTTNPSLILNAAKMDEYATVVDEAIEWAKAAAGEGASKKAIVDRACDRLAVEFGLRILAIIPGRVSTEVDARLSFDQQGTVDKARYIIDLYEKAGISRERILIKVASTWEGIQAAAELEKEGIHCNLTLLFGMHQAVACAEAGVTLISPFVGRILDWFKKDSGRDAYEPHEDPGVVSVTSIYNYYKRHGHETEVMGASFRNLGELTELAGCDLLTIAPKFLEVLQSTEAELPRKLDAEAARSMDIAKIPMDRTIFDRAHEEDRMANEKLAEGIAGFTKAIEELSAMLEARL